ncbi:MAG TPA: hypothetical protein VHO28_02765 [Ignavibacteriales bacterium]|nr:hypothetical protein [Ignavibacteriales bacterium]HEX3072461.1 hypothetical protein [Ignavibacteriales bacterium]
MISNKTKGIIGALLILTGCFVPLAFLNGEVISAIPLFGAAELGGGAWDWRDISFLAVNLILLPLISIYLSVKEKYFGLLITGSLSLLVVLILFATMLRMESAVYKLGGLTADYSWGWLLLLAGCVFLLLGSKKVKPKS